MMEAGEACKEHRGWYTFHTQEDIAAFLKDREAEMLRSSDSRPGMAGSASTRSAPVTDDERQAVMPACMASFPVKPRTAGSLDASASRTTEVEMDESGYTIADGIRFNDARPPNQVIYGERTSMVSQTSDNYTFAGKVRTGSACTGSAAVHDTAFSHASHRNAPAKLL